jgi:hypothetical protein
MTTAVPQDGDHALGTSQTRLEIGEIPVDIRTHVSCGARWWWGLFPDGSHCCATWAHTTRAEAVLCSRLRVAEGFVLREVPHGSGEEG